MKNKTKQTIKLLCMVLCLSMLSVLFLAGCNTESQEEQTTVKEESTTGSSTEKESESEVSLNTELEIKIAVLNGTTGFGIAKLINDKNAGNAALNYNISVETDASNVTAALINGSIDIAALPTNAAANVYNKTEGKIQIMAVNTLGVLYVVTSDKVNIESFADLEGKTVYCPAQNPEFVFKYLCKKNNLTPGENITIDTAYAQPADLRAAVASGAVDIAVLPEPMVTIAQSANNQLKVALDLTQEWNKVGDGSTLAQGCIVVRTEFAQNHPMEVAKFLEEYKASVEFTNEKPSDVSEMIVAAGIFSAAPVAAKAIPKCNICYVEKTEMATYLNGFFSALFEIAPASIGGKIPDNGIYYGIN